MESNAKLFSGTGSQYLAEKIAKKFGEPLGKVNIQTLRKVSGVDSFF